MIKLILILSAAVFSIVGLAMDPPGIGSPANKSEQIKQEILKNGLATFLDTGSSPFSEAEIRTIFEFYYANCKPHLENDVHYQGYSANFAQDRNNQWKSFKVPEGKERKDLRFMFDRILGIFPIPEDAKKIHIFVDIYSDIENGLRQGIEVIKSPGFQVKIPQLNYHQDRFDGENGAVPHFLYFQVLATSGFAPHNSLVGRVISAGEKSELNNQTYMTYYAQESVELIAKIPCQNGSGYALNQKLSPQIVHGRDPLHTVILLDGDSPNSLNSKNFILPHRISLVAAILIED